MSSLSDYFGAILAGGLPAALDLGSGAKGAQGDTRPEQTAPAGTYRDIDSVTVSGTRPFILTPVGIAVALGGTIVVGFVIFAAVRAGRR